MAVYQKIPIPVEMLSTDELIGRIIIFMSKFWHTTDGTIINTWS